MTEQYEEQYRTVDPLRSTATLRRIAAVLDIPVAAFLVSEEERSGARAEAPELLRSIDAICESPSPHRLRKPDMTEQGEAEVLLPSTLGSAERLQRIAAALDLPVAAFFGPKGERPEAMAEAAEMLGRIRAIRDRQDKYRGEDLMKELINLMRK